MTRLIRAVAAVSAALLLAACNQPETTPRVPNSLVSATVGPSVTVITTPARPAANGYQAALDELAELRVAPEDTGAHYRRDDWQHWIPQPQFGKGCDTREMVLREQGEHATPAGVGSVTADPNTCAPRAGDGNSWVSPYDGIVVTDPRELDVDHLVPLEEMARSGTRNWTRDQRKQYANDPAVLIAVTAHTNRQKGSQDPAHWLPREAGFQCEYDRRWVEVKHAYSRFTGPLTVDRAEHDALVRKLRLCAAAKASSK